MLELFQTQETVYLVVASFCTVLFGLKLVASLFLGGHDGGGGADHHIDSADSFTLLSTQSVLAFGMGVGWMGLAGRHELGFSSAVSLAAGAGFGVAMMLLAAGLAYGIKKLNHEVPFDLKTAVGTRGKVYLTIPERGTGAGQVEIAVQGRLRIIAASSTAEAIAAFTPITVVSVQSDGSLLVKPSN